MKSPDSTTPPHPPIRVALLACSVFEKEIALHSKGATHIAEVRYFEMGLHDRPDVLRSTLQENLTSIDARDDIDAIIFAYGLCGRGTAGLQPHRHKMVIPRAHDCITVFMGSKEAYADHQRQCPGCYYYTPGWNQGRRVPGPDKLEAMKSEFGAKFDPEDVEFLIESEKMAWSMHDTTSYLDLGTDDAKEEAAYAKKCAEWLGWKFEHLPSNPSLLRDLLWCQWDEARFQTIEPGMQLDHSPDAQVMRAKPADQNPAPQ